LTWAVARGSDSISGEIGRGTMEVLLAQPYRRATVLATQAAVTVFGALVLSLAVLVGTTAGLYARGMTDAVPPAALLPAAVNLFGFIFCVCGLTTFASSLDRYRWRTVGIAASFCLLQMMTKLFGRMWIYGGWLQYTTIFCAYEPQVFIVTPDGAWAASLSYNLVLYGLGLAGYTASFIVFTRRDLPAPI
ncbi:MAG: ABC transporter permease subunit, partial [Planctomycetia bacterium]